MVASEHQGALTPVPGKVMGVNESYLTAEEGDMMDRLREAPLHKKEEIKRVLDAMLASHSRPIVNYRKGKNNERDCIQLSELPAAF
jgi:hypothetical protein